MQHDSDVESKPSWIEASAVVLRPFNVAVHFQQWEEACRIKKNVYIVRDHIQLLYTGPISWPSSIKIAPETRLCTPWKDMF